MTEVIPEFYLGDLRLDQYPYSVLREDDGVDVGSAENVMDVVQSLLVDGDIVLSSRATNRTLKVSVLVEGADLLELSENEAALGLECEKDFSTFTIVPGDDFAPPTVFRIFKVQSTYVRDDRHEAALVRRWDLTIPAAPRAYSASEVVIDAQVVPTSGGTPVAPIDALVDNCSSATGWKATAQAGLSVVASGGELAPSASTLGSSGLQRTGVISMTGTPFLAVDIKVTTTAPVLGVAATITYTSAAVDAFQSPAAVGPSPVSPLHRRYFYRVSGDIASFVVGVQLASSSARCLINVTEVRKTNQPPATGTLRQKFFTADVPGSAPSQGTIEVSHPTSDLGTVLVHTTPSGGPGFVPALRPNKTSGGPFNADASLVSGGYETISSTPNVYQIPASLVATGTYEVGAWLRCNAAGNRTIQCTATMRDGAGVLTGGIADLSVVANFAAANTWYYFALGRIQLPTLRVPANSSSLVQLSVSATSGTVDLDEAYLFGVGRGGALTRVEVGSKNRLWIKAATIDWPMPSILVGTQDDESDAVAAAAVPAWTAHETTPPSINIFLVTRGALDANARVRLPPAWHSTAAL